MRCRARRPGRGSRRRADRVGGPRRSGWLARRMASSSRISAVRVSSAALIRRCRKPSRSGPVRGPREARPGRPPLGSHRRADPGECTIGGALRPIPCPGDRLDEWSRRALGPRRRSSPDRGVVGVLLALRRVGVIADAGVVLAVPLTRAGGRLACGFELATDDRVPLGAAGVCEEHRGEVPCDRPAVREHTPVDSGVGHPGRFACVQLARAEDGEDRAGVEFADERDHLQDPRLGAGLEQLPYRLQFLRFASGGVTIEPGRHQDCCRDGSDLGRVDLTDPVPEPSPERLSLASVGIGCAQVLGDVFGGVVHLVEAAPAAGRVERPAPGHGEDGDEPRLEVAVALEHALLADDVPDLVADLAGVVMAVPVPGDALTEEAVVVAQARCVLDERVAIADAVVVVVIEHWAAVGHDPSGLGTIDAVVHRHHRTVLAHVVIRGEERERWQSWDSVRLRIRYEGVRPVEAFDEVVHRVVVGAPRELGSARAGRRRRPPSSPVRWGRAARRRRSPSCRAARRPG